jgi:hypothetical protein
LSARENPFPKSVDRAAGVTLLCKIAVVSPRLSASMRALESLPGVWDGYKGQGIDFLHRFEDELC